MPILKFELADFDHFLLPTKKTNKLEPANGTGFRSFFGEFENKGWQIGFDWKNGFEPTGRMNLAQSTISTRNTFFQN